MTIVYEDYNLKHQPCPFSSCGSSDAFSYETNKKVGFCHSCGGKYSYKSVGLQDWAEDKYPTNKESNYMNVTEFTPKRIEDLSEGKYEAMRGINASTMQDYNVLTYDDRQEYIYPSGGIKVRKLGEKAFYAKDGFKGDELFGMNLYPAGCSKIVTITEGELDALSVCQMTQNQYLNPSVSLPSATPSKRLWENCKEWLSSFEKIILSVDNDDAGNALADRMARLFPNKVYRVQHGEYKDANDFLQAGREREFKNLWWKPLKHTPENILNTSDQFLKLYDETPEHVYYKTGIEALDDKILGLMQGHFTVFKAPTGIGKTELMRYMEYSMLQQNIPIAAWHLEETKLRSLLGLVSYEVGDNLTRRDLIEEKKADGLVREAIGNITKDENFYQFYLGDGQGADELIDQIRFFSQACDCKFVFFEPIQDVVVGTSEDSKESMLADLSIRLSKLAAELNVGIVTIAHTNENGDPKYCKMIGQRASVIIDLHRDKEADNMEERNTTYLKVEKNRPCSEEGQAGRLSFDLDTFMLTEIQ
jgi:twinkle protein